MAIIKYKMANGDFEKIEVTAAFKKEYQKLERKEKSLQRKETHSHESLEKLIEDELSNTSA